MILCSLVFSFNIDSKRVLIFNGLSGLTDVTTADLWKKVRCASKNDSWNKISSASLKHLIKRKYLLKNREEENNLLNKINKRMTTNLFRQKSLAVTINFSEDCNLACTYCFNKKRRLQGQMRIKQLKKIISFFDSQKERGIKIGQIVLFGGEPLRLESRPLLKYLLQQLEQRQTKVFIFTNGVTLHQYLDLLTRFRKLISAFQITVDGPASIHDQRRTGPAHPQTFYRITQNVDRLLKLKFRVNLRVNLDSGNFSYLPQLLRFLEEKKWPKRKNFSLHLALTENNCLSSCKENPIANSTKFIKKLGKLISNNPKMKQFPRLEKWFYNRAQEFLVNVLENKKNYRRITYCASGGALSYTFATDGYIYACMGAVGIPSFRLAKYYPKVIWNKKNLKLWKERLSINLAACKKCPLVYICGGNCALAAYEENGDFNQPACERTKENLQSFILLNKKEILKKAKLS